MVFAGDFAQLITHSGGEIVVGSDDIAVQIKFNHSVGSFYCFHAAAHALNFGDPRGDVGGKFDHFYHGTRLIEYRIVGGFQPDPATVFAQSAELIGDEFTLFKLAPQVGVGSGRNCFGGTQILMTQVCQIFLAVTH